MHQKTSKKKRHILKNIPDIPGSYKDCCLRRAVRPLLQGFRLAMLLMKLMNLLELLLEVLTRVKASSTNHWQTIGKGW